jgi:hypothetical protein
MQEKIEAARRQLGTALALFLQDLDPISVHCLASGAVEVIDFYAEQAGTVRFAQHALETVPELDMRTLRKLQRQYWNAFKHASKPHDGGERLLDQELLRRFDDEQNDHALFVGWGDYLLLVGKCPVEVQAFQVWYYARYPEKLIRGTAAIEHAVKLFPDLRSNSRSEQKRLLRDRVEEARADQDVMDDPRTEQRPLILPWP